MENVALDKRKEKFLNFIKSPSFWVIGLLIIAVILGVYIRSLPMQDHGGRPGLWDIVRNDWTLGPDLDQWLFTRQAKIISVEGSMPEIDDKRNLPLGFDNAKGGIVLLSYMIYWNWEFVNLFGDYSVEFAAVIFPVFMFAFTIIAFFLFVREVFLGRGKRDRLNANMIAIISTFIMITVPAFLSRTVAGIPEKESAIFFFIFLGFYFFLKAWKSKVLRNKVILALLAGITTAAGGLVSGLVIYIFITIGITTLFAFIINKVSRDNFIAYSVWLIASFGIMVFFSERFSFISLSTANTTGFAALAFFIRLDLEWHY